MLVPSSCFAGHRPTNTRLGEGERVVNFGVGRAFVGGNCTPVQAVLELLAEGTGPENPKDFVYRASTNLAP